MQSCIKSLSVSLSTLTQLVKNFCQSYETDFQPWVGHRQPPTLGPLGSLTKKTATHWDHICKVHTLHIDIPVLICRQVISWNVTLMSAQLDATDLYNSTHVLRSFKWAIILCISLGRKHVSFVHIMIIQKTLVAN